MKAFSINIVLFCTALIAYSSYAGGPHAKKSVALADLSQDIKSGLVYTREEEKLARDVYLELFDIHGLGIFNNIAASELSHTAAVQSLLDRYNIEDPVGENDRGEFTNPELQALYTSLVASGSPTLLDALYVGATIEDLDISDLAILLENVDGSSDIARVYNNLLRGSRNHLRSFHKQITRQNGEYTPVYISQTLYEEIVNSPVETGRR